MVLAPKSTRQRTPRSPHWLPMIDSPGRRRVQLSGVAGRSSAVPARSSRVGAFGLRALVAAAFVGTGTGSMFALTSLFQSSAGEGVGATIWTPAREVVAASASVADHGGEPQGPTTPPETASPSTTTSTSSASAPAVSPGLASNGSSAAQGAQHLPGPVLGQWIDATNALASRSRCGGRQQPSLKQQRTGFQHRELSSHRRYRRDRRIRAGVRAG